MLEQYIYDGTFEGFLTCVFDYYDRKSFVIKIVNKKTAHKDIFCDDYKVYTAQEKADRVWKGIQSKIGKKAADWIYRAFLSEDKDRERLLLSLIKKGFKGLNITEDFTDLEVVQLSKIVKMVGREKHRMDAFVRFRLTKDNIYFATVQPDFDVLPLNAIHFKNRYADQKWLIYDLSRNYGVYYDMKTVAYIELQVSKDINYDTAAPLYFTQDEMQYQDLWKNYFKSTNIPSRKNMRLHLQHVPKRYWKYLSEKKV